jgi:cell division septation protein DedD/nucleoid DNA-binding protein
MLRTEIINLLAEKAGVPQLEAARFMEIFLYKLSELLLEGDRFKLAGLGDFVISSRANAQGKKSGAGKIFQFSPASGGDTVPFGVPPAQALTANPIDEFFTLRINSKFIPVRGESLPTDELPPSPEEMRKYLDQHAGLLLQTGTFQRAQRAREPEPDFADEALSKEAFLPFAAPKAKQTREIPPAEEETSWEFGSDWKKEYEEDLLLDTEDDHSADLDFDFKVTREPDSMNWDFGPEEKPKAKPAEPEEETEHKGPKDFDIEAFAPVRSLTRELEIDLTELEGDQEEEEIAEEEDYEDDIVPEDFDALFKKSLAENVLSAQMAPPEEPGEDDGFHINESELEDNGEDGEVIPAGDGMEAIDLRGRKLSRHITPEEGLEFNGIRDTIEHKSYERPKSYVGYYILAFVLLTGAGCLVYTKLYGMPEWADKMINKKEAEVQLKASPTDIERDYAFPVSYPYEKVNVVMTPQPLPGNETKESAPAQQAAQEPVQKPVEQKVEKKIEQAPAKVVKETPAPDKSVKITSAAYKDAFIEPVKGGFEIQVMSLGANDKASAEKAAARLRSFGFNSFVVEKENPKRGIVNRVRVGPFTSRPDAEKALRKIKGE